MNAKVDRSYQLLNPLDRAQYFTKLISEGSSQKEIAESIGKSLPYVSNTLRLLVLPEFIQDSLHSGTISEGHARALLMVKDTDKQVQLFKEILVHNYSVRETEKKAKELNNL